MIIRSGPQSRRICRRSCAKLSDERFCDAVDSFDPMKHGTEVADRSGELRVLADYVSEIPKHMCILLYSVFLYLFNRWANSLLAILIVPNIHMALSHLFR